MAGTLTSEIKVKDLELQTILRLVAERIGLHFQVAERRASLACSNGCYEKLNRIQIKIDAIKRYAADLLPTAIQRQK